MRLASLDFDLLVFLFLQELVLSNFWFVILSDVLIKNILFFLLTLCMKFSSYTALRRSAVSESNLLDEPLPIPWLLTSSQCFGLSTIRKINSLISLMIGGCAPLLLSMSKLSLYYLTRQPPALPCRLQHSTIGRSSLNHRVRDVYGCFP